MWYLATWNFRSARSENYFKTSRFKLDFSSKNKELAQVQNRCSIDPYRA